MPPFNTPLPNRPAIRTIRLLTPADAGAVIAHYASLSPEDFYLRFGTSKEAGMPLIPFIVNQMFRSAVQRRQFLYGGWDADGAHLLLCLGLCVPDAARPSCMELHMSAVPEVRGGLVQDLSGWLLGELARRRVTEVVVTYQQGNVPVQRLVRQLGMTPVTFDGVPFFRLPVDAHARLIETWLQKTDQLLAAARQDMDLPPARL